MSDPRIFLYTNKEVVPNFSDGMYRTVVDGRSYCSGSLSGLIDAVGFFHSIYVTTDPVPVPERSESLILIDKLCGDLPLEEKQRAFRRLGRLALNSDSHAMQVVSFIKAKPISFGASIVTKWSGAKDFSEVSHVFISDTVGDIIHRAELLNELADRISLKHFSSKE